MKGELVGGADIVKELEQSGELSSTLCGRLGDGYESRDETTVALT